MKKITILGSTGSIGTQSLDVIRKNRDRFKVEALTCGKNIALFRKQIAEFIPAIGVCIEKDDSERLSAEFPNTKFLWGSEGIDEAATSECDMVLNSLMGMRGLVPTYKAIGAGHDIALANKETLVSGGAVIMDAAVEKNVKILPVDSEHSAVFQCLEGNGDKKIRRILLTCSGGPFRGYTRKKTENITPERALKHPNWSMGKKITIDSATLMNKGLEMIEAKWLFGVEMEEIEVLVHPQSIVHSAVEFSDSSVLAQLGVPDMRIPISVALAYPDRLDFPDLALDFFGEGRFMTFEKPDISVFRCLLLAVCASKLGGTYPAAMNAANEILVQAFLDKRIGFLDIEGGVEKIMSMHNSIKNPTLEDIIEVDKITRLETERIIKC